MLRRLEIQNAIIARGKAGTFPRVTYNKDTFLVNMPIGSPDNILVLPETASPTFVTANEIHSTFGIAGKHGSSRISERRTWSFELLMTFGDEVSLEHFEKDLTLNPIKLSPKSLLVYPRVVVVGMDDPTVTTVPEVLGDYAIAGMYGGAPYYTHVGSTPILLSTARTWYVFYAGGTEAPGSPGLWAISDVLGSIVAPGTGASWCNNMGPNLSDQTGPYGAIFKPVGGGAISDLVVEGTALETVPLPGIAIDLERTSPIHPVQQQSSKGSEVKLAFNVALGRI